MAPDTEQVLGAEHQVLGGLDLRMVELLRLLPVKMRQVIPITVGAKGVLRGVARTDNIVRINVNIGSTIVWPLPSFWLYYGDEKYYRYMYSCIR